MVFVIAWLGPEHIPTDRPYVVFVNISLHGKRFFMYTLLPRYSTILKEELLRIPVFRLGFIGVTNRLRLIVMINALPCAKLLSKVRLVLNKVFLFLCFPEGTRTAPGAAADYKIGGAKLCRGSCRAYRADCVKFLASVGQDVDF